MIPWHLRRGQALSEGVHVIVLLLQCGESHLLLLLLLLNVGIGGPQVLQLRGQSTTGGCCGAPEKTQETCLLLSVTVMLSLSELLCPVLPSRSYQPL